MSIKRDLAFTKKAAALMDFITLTSVEAIELS